MRDLSIRTNRALYRMGKTDMIGKFIRISGLSASLALSPTIGLTGFGISSLTGITTARADSCWWHNGSLMRLKVQGNQRWFYYERPRSGLAVGPGTLLFNGRKQGNWYVGTARVFSRYCPSTPLPYHVEGPVASQPVAIKKTVWFSPILTAVSGVSQTCGLGRRARLASGSSFFWR